MKYSETTELFNNSDLTFFDVARVSEITSSYNSKAILKKYPSDFFDMWLTQSHVNRYFTHQLIDNIANNSLYLEKQKWTDLLFKLIENKYYNKTNVVHLENLLLKYKLYYIDLFLRTHIKEKTQNIVTDNLNFLTNLTKIGIGNNYIYDRILHLSFEQNKSIIDMYDFVVLKMTKMDYDEQMIFVSKVNVEMFQLLVDSNVITLSDKYKHKILSLSALHNNIDLYIYLFNMDTASSKKDILDIFGLTSIKHKREIKSNNQQNNRRGRYRFRSSRGKFNKIFLWKSHIYTKKYVEKLTSLVRMYTKNNIVLDFKNMKKFIVHLLNSKHTELQLEMCRNIGYKHGGYNLNKLINQIIISNDPILLQKCINYSQIQTEKFVNGNHLERAIKANKLELAKYMIDVLKMKCTANDVVSGSSNVNKLTFLFENNLPIQNNVMKHLFMNGDIQSINFCIEKFNFPITHTLLMELITRNLKNSSIKFFKDNYSQLKTQLPYKASLVLLKDRGDSPQLLHVLKFLWQNKNLPQKIMPHILHAKNFNVIKFACNDHGLNIDNITSFDVGGMLRLKRWYSSYGVSKLEKLLDIYEYLNLNFPEKFKEIVTNLTYAHDNIISRISQLINKGTSQNDYILCTRIQNIFNFKLSQDDFIQLLERAGNKIPDWVCNIIDTFDEISNDFLKNLMRPYNNISIHSNILTYLKTKRNIKINIYDYASSTEIMKYILDNDTDINISTFISDYDIKFTPAIYSFIVAHLKYKTRTHGQGRSTRLLKKSRVIFNSINQLINILNKDYQNIIQDDYTYIINTLKPLNCTFNIIDYELTDDEKFTISKLNGRFNNFNFGNNLNEDDGNMDDTDFDFDVDDIDIQNINALIPENILIA
jgi:hypothetical protein